jgi:hypothetical protein
MRHVLLIAQRELRQRWHVAAAAAVLGAIPGVLIPSWPALHDSAGPVSVLEVSAAHLLAFLIGMGIYSEELLSGRIAWYFSRPLSGAAIWGGKLAAAVALAMTCSAAIAVPTALTVGWGRYDYAFQLVVFPVLYAALGIAFGIIARARTRWLVLDVVCVCAVGVLGNWTNWRADELWRTRPRAYLVIEPRLELVAYAALAAVIVALVAAGAAGIIAGRADARRAHAAVSLTLWAIVVPIGLGLLAYSSALLA